MLIILLALGFGCIWHGVQIIWVAPVPRQLRGSAGEKPRDSAQAFQLFWLDQYGWIGIALTILGVGMIGWSVG